MKKTLLMFLLISNIFIFADENTNLILQEIKNLRHDMDKRLETMQHNMDKRFEQVDKRFDQVDKRFEQSDKRFETVFNILYILMGLVFASPFIVVYLRDKKEAEHRKNFEIIQGMLKALKKIAKHDEEVATSLRVSKLL